MKKWIVAAVLALPCLALARQAPAEGEIAPVPMEAAESDKWTEFRDGNGSVFKKLKDGKWAATQKDGTVFRFVETARDAGSITLFDHDRKMIVRLTKDKGLWQQFQPWPGSEGTWDKAKEEFRDKNGSVFRKGRSGWTATQKDGTVFTFEEVGKADGGVALYDRDRDIYVLLGETAGLWDHPLRPWPGSDGSWSK